MNDMYIVHFLNQSVVYLFCSYFDVNTSSSDPIIYFYNNMDDIISGIPAIYVHDILHEIKPDSFEVVFESYISEGAAL